MRKNRGIKMNSNSHRVHMVATMMAFFLVTGCGGGDDPVKPGPTSPPSGFALIPPVSVPMPTTFIMGSTVGSDETPHQVTFTGRFYMAATDLADPLNSIELLNVDVVLEILE